MTECLERAPNAAIGERRSDDISHPTVCDAAQAVSKTGVESVISVATFAQQAIDAISRWGHSVLTNLEPISNQMRRYNITYYGIYTNDIKARLIDLVSAPNVSKTGSVVLMSIITCITLHHSYTDFE